MLDQRGRKIDYIRISITDRCNLRCVYCMPKEGVKLLPHDEILSYDEITYIVRCMALLGVKKVKITGGEPLVRRECDRLIRDLKQIPGIERVTLTTNGVLLKEMADKLAAAGIDAINVSLDTMDREQYAQITRVDCLNETLEGIKAVLAYPQIRLKINCVPTDYNRDNLCAIAGLAKEHPIHVRFIEMMPIGYGKQFEFCSEDMVKQLLCEAYGPMKSFDGILGNGPSHYFSLDGFKGKIGFISSLSHKFCGQCNRVRLTAEGFLKCCLQYDSGVDLKKMLREGAREQDIEEAIREAIWRKPESHHFKEEILETDEQRSMSQIGG